MQNITLGAINHTHKLQLTVFSSNGESISLLYPVSMISSSIGYSMIPSCGSIASVLPSCLISANDSTNGFIPVANHIQSSLTNHVVTTYKNPTYIA